MGLDVHGKIIVGEKRSLIKTKVNVTKYNEDTGEPYQVSKDQEHWLTEDGCDLVGFIDDKLIEVHSNYEENFDIVGIKVSRTNLRDDEEAHCKEFLLIEIHKAKQSYLRITGREARLYNFLSYSC